VHDVRKISPYLFMNSLRKVFESARADPLF
jgi:hypothetical protein